MFIFLSALFLFSCFFADFLINLPKYIILIFLNDAIINDQTGVATVLNDYYVNVTKSIGEPDLLDVNEDIENVFLVQLLKVICNPMNQYNILNSI